jgi:hypothetical protein
MSARTRVSVRKWIAAVVFALACLGVGGASTRAAQPAQPAARDEFVPIREIPLWSLWRRLGRVESELQTLTGRLSSRGR